MRNTTTKLWIAVVFAAMALAACGGADNDGLVLDDVPFDRVPSITDVEDGLVAAEETQPYLPNPLKE